MKIDKRNPMHWLYLILSAICVVAALFLRPFVGRGKRPLVLLYGHKLNGNLKSLYDEIDAHAEVPFDFAFMTLEPAYYRNLLQLDKSVILGFSPAAIVALARCRCVVSDHGLHTMSWLPRLRSIAFIDVWHGIPFKGWDADDFLVQHHYDAIWVSSVLIAKFYTERFGFRPEQIAVTGYGRTDRLVNQAVDCTQTRADLQLPSAPTRLILFAPTWQHGDDSRDIFPFGVRADAFYQSLREVCERHDAACLFRTHLNVRTAPPKADGPFYFVPQDRFPDTEAILAVSDILVCDWSSIAFDFLVLNRPTVFLDVPAPFEKGFSLGPEYRFGAVVPSLETLCSRLADYLAQPENYTEEFGQQAERIKRAVYDDYADGQAARRYRERLTAILD
jgi:CDP-glycerol glycerophosphotransferase (TagB/SpsB family)